MTREPYSNDVAMISRYALSLFIATNQVTRNSGKITYAGQDPYTRRHIFTLEALTAKHAKAIQRNVSIAVLGEGSESKSKCFLLVYNRPIVIKIPPKAPVTFSRYLEDIHVERRIAELLGSDIHTITPGIAPILMTLRVLKEKALIPHDTGFVGISKSDIEAHYAALVEKQILMPLPGKPDQAVFIANLFLSGSQEELKDLQLTNQERYRLFKDFMAQLEWRYEELAKMDFSLQEHLQVNGRFAFFMDLLEYAFFSTFLEQLEPDERTLRSELEKAHTIIGQPRAFTRAFGLAPEIQKTLTASLEDLRKTISRFLPSTADKANVQLALAEGRHQTSCWAMYLILDYPIFKSADYPEKFFAELNSLQAKLRRNEAFQAQIQPYKTAFRQRAFQRYADRKYAVMRKLATELLALSEKLRARGIAVRDLKPDNIFVVAPGIDKIEELQHTDFKLGLIDLETAVAYKVAPRTEVAQPLMGGSPQHATLSHFFLNTHLKALYGDLQLVFYFQDLYAFTGLLFEAVTNAYLFTGTSKIINGLLKTLQAARSSGDPDYPLIYKQFSRRFWKQAEADLQANMKPFAAHLKAVCIYIPPFLWKVIGQYAKMEKQAVKARLAALSTQYEAGRSKLQKIQHLTQQKADVKIKPEALAAQKAAIKALAEEIRGLKAHKSALDSVLLMYRTQAEAICIHELVTLLFGAVKHFMHPRKWDQN